MALAEWSWIPDPLTGKTEISLSTMSRTTVTMVCVGGTICPNLLLLWLSFSECARFPCEIWAPAFLRTIHGSSSKESRLFLCAWNGIAKMPWLWPSICRGMNPLNGCAFPVWKEIPCTTSIRGIFAEKEDRWSFSNQGGSRRRLQVH